MEVQSFYDAVLRGLEDIKVTHYTHCKSNTSMPRRVLVLNLCQYARVVSSSLTTVSLILAHLLGNATD